MGLQQTIEESVAEYGRLERAAESLRSEVQLTSVEKQRNLANLLKLQRAAKRMDEMSMGTGPPPPQNVRTQYAEQMSLKNKTIDIVKVLADAYPQLEQLWAEFFTWLEVQAN